MMPDKIHDLALGPCGVAADGEMNAVLACGDRCVRVMKDSAVAYEVSIKVDPFSVSHRQEYAHPTLVLPGALGGCPKCAAQGRA